jgi:cell division protein FtsQ
MNSVGDIKRLFGALRRGRQGEKAGDKASTAQEHLRTVRFIVGAVVLSSLLGVAVLLGIHKERNTPIQELRLRNAVYTTENELDGIRLDLIGVLPDSLPLADLTMRVQALPYVDTLSIKVEAGGVLIFDLVEYQPIAILEANGREAYVDPSGVVLPVRPGGSGSMPLVYGFPVEPKGRGFAPVSGMKGFAEVAAFLQAARGDAFGWISISEVAWDPAGGVVALSHENGVKVLFGKEDFEEKFQKWTAFYREIVLSKGIGSFQFVDLRFKGQIVTREGTS